MRRRTFLTVLVSTAFVPLLLHAVVVSGASVAMRLAKLVDSLNDFIVDFNAGLFPLNKAQKMNAAYSNLEAHGYWPRRS